MATCRLSLRGAIICLPRLLTLTLHQVGIHLVLADIVHRHVVKRPVTVRCGCCHTCRREGTRAEYTPCHLRAHRRRTFGQIERQHRNGKGQIPGKIRHVRMLQCNHILVGQHQGRAPGLTLQPVVGGIVKNGEHNRPHLEVDKTGNVYFQCVQTKKRVV
ncbi:Uncharacterised protein [Enterobacter hormaechei]|nr:Uncharacterised protein [Enterobacter hormaechei]